MSLTGASGSLFDPHDGEDDVDIILDRIKEQRFDRKLMQNYADGGYDRQEIHPRQGGDDHAIPLARRHALYPPRITC